jgi:hypothetical protein
MYGIVLWGLSETRKELDKVHSRFGKKLKVILNCAASGFPEMELGREQERQVHWTDCKVLVLDYVSGYRRPGKTHDQDSTV